MRSISHSDDQAKNSTGEPRSPQPPTDFDKLLERVYPRLRALAQFILNQHRSGSFRGTELANEACARLLESMRRHAKPGTTKMSEPQLVGLLATVMRNYLIDRARAKTTMKRTAPHIASPGEVLDAEIGTTAMEFLELDSALNRLAVDYPQEAEVISLLLFGGCEVQVAAELLGVDRATIRVRRERGLALLRARLENR